MPAEGYGYLYGGAGGVGVPARSKMVGVWETGEGEQVPPPRQPLPQWRYPHGPQHGEILEKSRIRFPAGSTPDTVSHRLHPGYGFPPAPPRIRLLTRSTPDTAAPLISPRTAHAPGGGGGGAPQARAGWGVPAEAYGYPPTKARAGWGLSAESVRVPLAEEPAGRGLPAESVRVPLAEEPAGWGCRQRA